jgi:hypothetical protein
LGFFEVTNALANLWSPDCIENPEQSRINSPIKISTSLRNTLKKVRRTFADSLLEDAHLLSTILRPNLDELILPLLEPKRVKTVIIYSNTGVTYSTELAKYLIETKYAAPQLFSLQADAWHPLRTADRGPILSKRIETLQLLFQQSTGTTQPIPLKNIVFVDDLIPKHTLKEQEKDGLRYVVPTKFVPSITAEDKELILLLAWSALEKHGLFNNREYLNSPFFHRKIPYEHTKFHTIDGVIELFDYVMSRMESVKGGQWKPDRGLLQKMKV